MGPKISYNPEKDIPDLSGKVFFITGGTAGLGKQTIEYLSKHSPASIHFTGRNAKAGEQVIAEVKKAAPNVTLRFYECDQSSLASVNVAADAFLAENTGRLDVLICNAGMMGGSLGLTKDGYEIQFGTNYLAHALFTKRFTPLLQSTASMNGEARVVNLSSSAYEMHSGGIAFDDLKTTQENIGMGGKWARYGQSKFAQVAYTGEFAKRYPDITAVAIHPGAIPTNLIEGLPMFDWIFIKLMVWRQWMPLEQGSYTTCWAATTPDKDVLKSGGLYYPVGVPQQRTKAASDEKLWAELWDWTDEQLEI